MATELLDYQGNAGLGIGSTADVAGGAKSGLDIIQQTARDIMLMDNERNMKIYDQKIKDRDNLEQLILNNQVALGNIDPKYQPYFDRAKKGVEDAYKEWGGNFNDVDGFRRYQAKVNDLKDVAAQAQTRTASEGALKQARAQTTLPERQKEMDAWYEQQTSKPFWEKIDPFQQSYDFNIAHIDFAKPITTTITPDRNNPQNKEDVSIFSYDDTRKNANHGWLNNQDVANSIDTFREQFQRYNPQQRAATIGALNDQLQAYNEQVGQMRLGRPLRPGDADYAPPIGSAFDKNSGQLIITDPTQDFAAKYSLAQQKAFVSRTPKFDKEIAANQIAQGKLGLDAQKLQLAAKRLGLDAQKAGAYMRHMDALTKKLTDQGVTTTDVSAAYNGIIDAIKPEALTFKTSVGIFKDGKVVSKQPTGEVKSGYIAVNDLPKSYRLSQGPVVDSKGKIVPGDLEPFVDQKTGVSYYIPKYVDATTGDEIKVNSGELKQKYDGLKKVGYNGTYEGFVKEYYDALKVKLREGKTELIWKGKNGSSNYSSLLQSGRLINAQATSKGEENIINPPESTPQDLTDENQ